MNITFFMAFNTVFLSRFKLPVCGVSLLFNRNAFISLAVRVYFYNIKQITEMVNKCTLYLRI